MYSVSPLWDLSLRALPTGWKGAVCNFWILSNLHIYVKVSLRKLLPRSLKSCCGTPKVNTTRSTNALATSSAVCCSNGTANRSLGNSPCVVNVYRLAGGQRPADVCCISPSHLLAWRLWLAVFLYHAELVCSVAISHIPLHTAVCRFSFFPRRHTAVFCGMYGSYRHVPQRHLRAFLL
jgi:hypothetical protein